MDNSWSNGECYCRLYWAHALIRQYLTTGRKYALIKKYALNKHVCFLTRLYSIYMYVIPYYSQTARQCKRCNRHSASQVHVVAYLQISVGACTAIFVGSCDYFGALNRSLDQSSLVQPTDCIQPHILYLNQAGSYFSNPLKLYSLVPQQQSLHNEALVTKECLPQYVTKLKGGRCFKALSFNPSTIRKAN